MKFGKTIRLEAQLPWNTKWVDFYVDYKELKQILGKYVQNGKFENPSEIPAFMEKFKKTWKQELAKVDNHIKNERKGVRELLVKDGTSAGSMDQEKKQAKIMKRSLTLKRIATFRDINAQGLQKIVKKAVKQLGDLATSDVLDELELLNQKVLQMNESHVTGLMELNLKLESTLGANSEVQFDEETANKLLQSLEIEDEVPIPLVRELVLDSLPPCKVSKIKLGISTNELGDYISVPVIVAKGAFPGPVLGLTSALHGNELNGIPLIFRLLRELDVETLSGTLVAVPVLNPPGYQRRQRGFHDGQDLNRLFPGKPDGNCGQVYDYHVMNKLIKTFEYHIDLHTASFGRVNSLYVKADMNDPITNTMATLQRPQIIVHNTAPDGSLRSAACANGIASITLEIGDPLSFNTSFITRSLYGVDSVMRWLNMRPADDDEIAGKAQASEILSPTVLTPTSKSKKSQKSKKIEVKTTICTRSGWLYSQHGGVLRVKHAVNTWVEKGEVIADVMNLFGSIIATYRAPDDAIVVGKSSNPICSAGDRIVHLGYVGESFGKVADDGHT